MDSLKTGFIVLLLLAVLYGVYVILNQDAPTPPTAEIAWHQQKADEDLRIEISTGDATPTLPGAPLVALDSTAKPATLAIPSSVQLERPAPEPPSRIAANERWPARPDAAGTGPENVETAIEFDQAAASGVAKPSSPAGPSPSNSLIAAPTLLATPSPTASSLLATPDAPNSALPAQQNDWANLPSLRTESAPSASSGDRAQNPYLPPGTDAPAPASSSLATVSPSQPLGAATVPPSFPASPASPEGAFSSEEPNTGARLVSAAVAFESAKREVQSNLAAEQWYQALFMLSKFYGSADLSAKQHQELLDLIDPLAARVVYSPQHLVTDAYVVRRGDTLAQISAAYQVPPELLANVNGVDNPNLLVPGTKLKVVRGPFRADLQLSTRELTLFVGQLYAGRFPVSIGNEPLPQPGEYRVIEKLPGRDYFPATGPLLEASHPQNPYGGVWIGLDRQLAIHASPQRGDSGPMGCISLSPLDAGDVYGILSVGSSIVIRP